MSDKYLAQARAASAVCLSRTLNLLHLLEERDIALEELAELLRKRDAAYYNFLAADQLLLAEGFDCNQDSQLRKTALQIVTATEKLYLDLRTYMGSVDEELQKVLKVRQGIRRFRSGALHQTFLNSYT